MKRLLPLSFLFVVVFGLTRHSPAQPRPTASGFTASPQELLARYAGQEDPGNDGYFLMLTEDEFTFRPDGTVTRRRYSEGKAFDAEAAEDWGSTSIQWEPWHEDKPQLRARVIDREGKEYQLDPATIAEAAANENVSGDSIYNDLMVLRAPLPGIGEGAIRITESIVHERTPVFPIGSMHFARVLRGAPARLHRVVIRYPASLRVTAKAYRLEGIQPARTERDGMVELVFEVPNIDPDKLAEAEQGLPRGIFVSPYIAISLGTSWEDLATRYHSIVEERVKGAMEAGILPRPKPMPSDPVAKIKAIAELMHREIRYTGVEFGESALIPQPPSVVLERKFGDCKDKSALLISMLRAAGIQAYFVLVDASSTSDVDAELPGISTFNHAIVMAELPDGKGQVWIDATADLLPAGILPASVQDRSVLIARPGEIALVRTPQSTSAENLIREIREYRLVEEGRAGLVETTEAHGQFGWQYREWFSTWKEDDENENLQQYLKDEFASAEFVRAEHGEARNLEGPAKLVIVAKDVQRGISEQREAVVAILQSRILNKLPEIIRTKEAPDADEESGDKLSVRRNDFLLSYPFAVEQEYRIHPPPGFALRTLPTSEQLAFGPIELGLHYRQEADGVVVALLRLDTRKRQFKAEEIRAANKAILEFNDRPTQLVYFDQVGERLLSKGDVRGALEEFVKLTSKGANPSLTLRRRARALLQAAAGAASRKLAAQAVELEPQSAKAHWLLGFVLQHDLVGRHRAVGYDREGSIASLRRAHALDPSDDEVALDLAIQLEFDAEGERYTRIEDVREAAELYRLVLKRTDNRRGFINNLLQCLVRLREFEEMRTLLATLPVDATNAGFRAATTALLESPEAAVNELRASSVGEAQRPSSLQLAASLMLHLREYQAFVKLIREAAVNNPAAQQLAAQANLYSLVTRWEPQAPPFKDAASMVKDIVGGVILGTISEEELKRRSDFALLSPEEAAEAAKALVKSIGEHGKNFVRQGLPRPVVVDVVMAVTTWTVDGDEETGFRVTLKSPILSQTGVAALHAAKGGEQGFRLVGASVVQLGAMAWDHLEHGRLEAARQALSWANETLEQTSVTADEKPLPFVTLFRKAGQESDLRLAAATLLLEKELTPQASTYLAKSLAQEKDAARQRAIREALALNYLIGDRPADAASVLLPTLAEPDLTIRELGEYCRGVIQSGSPDSCTKIAKGKLPESKSKAMLYELMIDASARKGDYEAVYALTQEAIRLRDSGPNPVNTRAWTSLFIERDMPQALTDMQKMALSMPMEARPLYLHTMAYLQAELGKTQEARQMADEVMQAGDLREPNDAAWLVYARIYENYGLEGEAREAYSRVAAPKTPDPLGVYELAGRRLKRLGTSPGKKVAAAP